MSLITEHDVLDQKLRAQAKSWKSRAENTLILLNTAKDTIARLRALNARLIEDAERLASTYVVEVFPHEWVCRGGCHHWARFGEQIDHAPDCPITLHRQLMAEINGKPNCTMEEK